MTNGTNVETHYRATVASSCRRSSRRRRSPSVWATSTCSSPARSPTTRASCSSRRPGPMAEGGAVPELRPRPLPGHRQRPHRLGPRRLHHDGRTTRTPRTPTPAPWRRERAQPRSFNYVRNSVKVVIDAYTGKMTFYVMDPNDPIIQTYEKAFPGMFIPPRRCAPTCGPTCATPRTSSPSRPRSTGSTTSPTPRASTAPPTPGRSRPTPVRARPYQAAATTQTVNAQGQVVSTGQLVRMSPIYQMMRIPGETTQSFNLLDALVPVSTGSQIQTLSGFMIAGSRPGPLRPADDVRDADGTTRSTGRPSWPPRSRDAHGVRVRSRSSTRTVRRCCSATC